MGIRTNTTNRQAVSYADEIQINSLSDLINNTNFVNANLRRVYPMKTYRFSNSIFTGIDFTLETFGQTCLMSGCVTGEDYFYSGGGNAIQSGQHILSIISFSDNGSGGTTVTLAPGEKVAPKMNIKIDGIVAYNGSYRVQDRDDTDVKIGDSSFDIDVVYTTGVVGGETATIINSQLVIDKINIIAGSGTLLNVIEQSLIFLTSSFFQANNLGILGAYSFLLRDNAFGNPSEFGVPETGGYNSGFIIQTVAPSISLVVQDNLIVSDKTGNQNFLNLDNFNPTFEKILISNNNTYIANNDSLIVASSQSHKNLTATGRGVIINNTNNITLNASSYIEGINKAHHQWNLSRNTSTDNTRIEAFASTNANLIATPVASNVYGVINVTGMIQGSITEGWLLTDSVQGIFTYIGADTFSGTMTFTINASKTGSTERYRFIASIDGSVPGFLTAGYEPLEIKSELTHVTLITPITVVTNQTIQVLTGGENHTDSLTISDFKISIV